MEPDLEGRDISLHNAEGLRRRVAQHLIQQIENDPEYPTYPPHCQEDYMWYRLNDLEDDNHLPNNTTAFDLFAGWIESRRPDAHVIHLGEVISERARFYE
jgi:hypothetical protein